MEDLGITLVWLAFFACIFFGWYFYLQARNKERMALIEKNANAAEIFKKREFNFKFPWLKLGMIVLGMGIGLFIPVVYDATGLETRVPEGMLVIGGMMIFGGLGLVIANFIEKPKAN